MAERLLLYAYFAYLILAFTLDMLGAELLTMEIMIGNYTEGISF